MIKKTVDIKPGIGILGVLRFINYTAWHALGEFVDNSIQSSIRDKNTLKKDPNYTNLIVDIVVSVDKNRITIKDNAAGIEIKDFSRAFRPAVAPEDKKGLSEFGMGMKSASCWFAPNWKVRTKVVGENIERVIEFDIKKIVKDDLSELTITENPADISEHYTEIILDNVFKIPKGSTLKKIREHLSSIYRPFSSEREI